MFLGPPRLGKSTTRRRVMKEIVDLQSAEEAEDRSTEETIPVKKISQPSVLHRITGRVQSLTAKKQLPEPQEFTPPSPTKARSDNDWVVSPDYSEIAAIFKEVSQQPLRMRSILSGRICEWRTLVASLS